MWILDGLHRHRHRLIVNGLQYSGRGSTLQAMTLTASRVRGWTPEDRFYHLTSVVAAVARLMTMGGTRIFELGAARGQGGGHGAKENGCYRTFNGGKRAAGALAVNDQKWKEIQHWLCSVLTSDGQITNQFYPNVKFLKMFSLHNNYRISQKSQPFCIRQ